MKKRIELVIFDLDGTLVDAYPAIVSSFNKTLKMFGLAKQPERTIRRAVGWGDGNLLKPFVPKQRLAQALDIYRAHHRISLRQETKFLPGALEMLRFLKQGRYKIALASNRPTKFSHIILEHLNIKRYFDCILCGDKVKRAKPYPDILRLILEKMKLGPSSAVYLGDMTVDVLAGKRAGIKTIAVTGGSSTRKELEQLKPYRIIRSVKGLRRILQQLNEPLVH